MNTQEIKLPSGAVLVLKKFITYGDKQDINRIYLNDKLDASTIVDQADKKTIEVAVVSIDGDTTNIYKRFLDLPFLEVKDLVLPVIKEMTDPKVAGSSSETTPAPEDSKAI